MPLSPEQRCKDASHSRTVGVQIKDRNMDLLSLVAVADARRDLGGESIWDSAINQ